MHAEYGVEFLDFHLHTNLFSKSDINTDKIEIHTALWF